MVVYNGTTTLEKFGVFLYQSWYIYRAEYYLEI